MLRYLLIFLGGGSGSILRYLVGGWVQPSRGTFPLGTLVVNVTGCVVIGILASLFTGAFVIRDEYRMGILVGVLGGFTTFSSFSWETVNLANDGEFWFAALNVLLSVGLGLAATWLTSRFIRMTYGI